MIRKPHHVVHGNDCFECLSGAKVGPWPAIGWAMLDALPLGVIASCAGIQKPCRHSSAFRSGGSP